ncbi:MAG: V-type ATP synthase subunit F [Promethearchaeota archaeon]
MSEEKIHVLGSDEIVILLGLLGIEGTVLDKTQNILKKIKELILDPKITMIIVALDIPDNVVEFLIDYKLNNRKPFIFHLQDIFKIYKEKSSIMVKIIDSIGNILS